MKPFVKIGRMLGYVKPKTKFVCGYCGKTFEIYHDGDGYNSGLCPECSYIQNTVGLDEKPTGFLLQI